WDGPAWKQPLPIPGNETVAHRIEQIRKRVVAPFLQLEQALAPTATTPSAPTGAQLADALRRFWNEVRAEARLEQWSQRELPGNELSGARTAESARTDASQLADSAVRAPRRGALPEALVSPVSSSLHNTAWEQMQEWLHNLALAFPAPGEARSLAEWLPIM